MVNLSEEYYVIVHLFYYGLVLEGQLMAITGKTGADAVFTALHHICKVLNAYRIKLDNVIDAAETAGVITSTQATQAHDFLATVNVVCGIFELIAGYSGTV